MFRLTPEGQLAPAPGEHAGPSPDGVSPLVARLLAVRGIRAGEAMRMFLDPRLSQLHDPSLMPDLDRAAQRILSALSAGERIVIYGDYDVDGVTATAILFHMCKAIAPACDLLTYVPHRLEEGYGLNSEAIRELAASGARLIVSVDCGVTAVEPARVAHEAGVDLIITDHHTPPDREDLLPSAHAVVHPRRPGQTPYPFGDVCGAGVAYKLAWRLATLSSGGAKARQDLRELLVELLAFAALGTIADVVPLQGENRVLARFGLVRIRHSPLPGLKSLVAASGLDGDKIDEMDVGFGLAPRLNAAGRMGHAKDAVELFTTASGDRADEIARLLSRQNEARREVERKIFETACAMAEASGMTAPDRRAIVLAHEDWHPGVVGIACSRLVERYHRPVILMQARDGLCHGSGRSIDGFNLHAGLLHCAEHLDRFGGHTMAAGLHLTEAKLPAFVEAFTAFANAAIDESLLRSCVNIDCEAAPEELVPSAVWELDRLGPFGAGNPAPQLLIRNLRLTDRGTMGANAKHLSVRLRSSRSSGGAEREFRCVAWNWGEHAPRLPIGATVDAVVRARVSTFSGTARVEPEIVDIALQGAPGAPIVVDQPAATAIPT
jgi:single-stranded-DNA-specific exonuclease